MPTIAYLANHFPSPLEPYVVEEILELRRRGVDIIPCTAWRTKPAGIPQHLLLARETLTVLEVRLWLLFRALAVFVAQIPSLWEFLARVCFRGKESPIRRLKALIHTFVGVYYALLLAPHQVKHIHVHHGYFSAWVAMVAARVLGIGYTITLHGSDIFVQDAYLDIKIKKSTACFTISEYNRNYLLRRFSDLPPDKIIVKRLGVDTEIQADPPAISNAASCMVLLSVGRLHEVKNHAFLIEACKQPTERGVKLICLIAGEGPERKRLERQISALGVKSFVKLLGHLGHEDLDHVYPLVDLVVLTSRSEGIPLVLMEAMSQRCVVLAPAITGIPELVMDGKTGFLYAPGSLEAFVSAVEKIRDSLPILTPLREAAHAHVVQHFDRASNLDNFVSALLKQVSRESKTCYAHPILQQV